MLFENEASRYGVLETNNISDFDDRLKPGPNAPTLDWTEVAEITRLRLVTDRDAPCWDVSYCYGLTHEDVPCRVQLPFHQLPKKGLNAELIRYARADRLWLKDLGLFDAISKCW